MITDIDGMSKRNGRVRERTGDSKGDIFEHQWHCRN